MKRLAILGSTGSIGTQTLEVVRAFPGRFEVVALAAGRNLALLRQQIAEFHPLFYFAEGRIEGEAQFLTMEAIASHLEVDLVMVATSGQAGLMPTLAALKAGKRVALANKEVLVMAGEIVTAEARRWGGELLPVDSEHSALWQCLRGEERKEVARLLLTASGGPFLNIPWEELTGVEVEAALNHPTWRMGKKVTVDSATLMNKGFEVIEAHWLFGIPYDRIEVILHPQSIIHSMVEFRDGSIKAQLSFPDMRLPIQHALSYPQRWENPAPPRLDWGTSSTLTFQRLEAGRFPCFDLAREAALKGGSYPAVLSAADEVAVELFLQRRIAFLAIPEIIEAALASHRRPSREGRPSLLDILDASQGAREEALRAGERC